MPSPTHRCLPAVLGVVAVVASGLTAPAALASTSAVTVTVPSTVQLTGTVRDFEYGTVTDASGVRIHGNSNCAPGINPDFQEDDIGGDDHPGPAGRTASAVSDTLTADGTPSRLATSTSIHSDATFAQWYHDVSGTNLSFPSDITLTRNSTTGIYHYAANEFFPADNHGWAVAAGCAPPQLDPAQFIDDNNQIVTDPSLHNFSFTYQIHASFNYHAGDTFSFAGDDDIWVYLNKHKVIDLGGLHPRESASVSLDNIASTAGMTPGHNYDFDLFFAERHTTASSFAMDTTLALESTLSANGLTVATTADGPVRPGANDIAIAAIPPTAYPLVTQAAVASAPVRSVPVRSVPVRSVPVRSVPVRSVPVRSVPVRSVPLDTVLLSQIPLVGTTWQQQLDGTTLAGAQPDTVTLVQALAALDAANKPGPTLGQMDLSQTPLRDMTLASIFLGKSTLNQLAIERPVGASATNTNFQNWCAWFLSQGSDVCSAQISSTSTLLAADLVGAPVRSVPVRSVPVRSVPADAPVRSVNLLDIGGLADTPVGQVPLSDIVLTNAGGTPTKFGAILLSALRSGDGLLGLQLNPGTLTDTCDAGGGCTTLGSAIGSGF